MGSRHIPGTPDYMQRRRRVIDLRQFYIPQTSPNSANACLDAQPRRTGSAVIHRRLVALGGLRNGYHYLAQQHGGEHVVLRDLGDKVLDLHRRLGGGRVGSGFRRVPLPLLAPLFLLLLALPRLHGAAPRAPQVVAEDRVQGLARRARQRLPQVCLADVGRRLVVDARLERKAKRGLAVAELARVDRRQQRAQVELPLAARVEEVKGALWRGVRGAQVGVAKQ